VNHRTLKEILQRLSVDVTGRVGLVRFRCRSALGLWLALGSACPHQHQYFTQSTSASAHHSFPVPLYQSPLAVHLLWLKTRSQCTRHVVRLSHVTCDEFTFYSASALLAMQMHCNSQRDSVCPSVTDRHVPVLCVFRRMKM